MLTRIRQLIRTFTRIEQRAFFASVALFALAVIAGGARYVYAHTTLVPADGDEYVEGIVGQPVTVNPVLSQGNDVDRDIITLLFSGLAELSEQVVPSEGGKVWTATLKKDIRWSDSEALTSDDVLFTLETIQDIASRSPLFPTWQGVVAERLSEREIKFTLKTPYAFFADNLRDLRVIPRHIFGNIPAANLRLSTYNLEPVGSGPYVFRRYEKQKDGFITDYILEANPHFAGNKPHLATFHFKFFIGTADVLRSFNRFVINGIGGLTAKDLSSITVGNDDHYLDIPRYYAVFFNTGLHPALKERDVREALTRATDRANIAGTLFEGDGHVTPVYGPITPSLEGYDASRYINETYTPADAQKLLDKAGWVLGSDGVREKMFGRSKVKLELDMVVPQIQFLIDAANIIKENWATVGVKLTPLIMNPQDIANDVLKTRNYQLLLFGEILGTNPDIFAFWHSSERFSPGLNLSVYENKAVDTLLESIRKEMNPDARLKSIGKLQDLLLNDRPAIFLFNPGYLYVTDKQLQGFDAATVATPANRFDGVTSWYFRTRRVWR
ncbi:MAG: peptide ABC transporter substrate-binding protein [bacterium]|nr:peptide ABC transporter substrate-binding protein [bacterium]